MKQIKIKLSEPIVKNDGQFAVHDPQRLEKENIRTLMKAFHGCRKNCAECQEEAEWEPKIKQKEVVHG